MKKLFFKNILIVTIVIFFFLPIIGQAKAKDLPKLPLQFTKTKPDYKEGEIIVKYKDINTKKSLLSQLSSVDKNSKDLEIKNDFKDINIAVIKSTEKTTKELLNEFKDNPKVEYAEPNYKKHYTWIPNDTDFADDQWPQNNDGNNGDTLDADIDAVEMWDIENSGATPTTIAVIDSGVHYTESDISQNLWDGTNCVDENNASIVGGCPHYGWDYYDNDNDPDDTTNVGHGTFITSIIASTTNNSSYLAGMSRYNNLKIMALRFDLYVDTEIKAINFAKNNGAKVINMSFSATEYSQVEKDAIDAFPGIVVTASGNGGSDGVGDDNDVTPQYPCNYDSSNVICVGASDDDDDITSFSNYGVNSVDLVAPGDFIAGLSYYNGSWQYVYGGGTSYSSPFVASVAGLMYAHKPTASMDTIKNTLLKSSDHKKDKFNKVHCARRLNAYNALYNIQNNIIPSESCVILTPIYRLYNKRTGTQLYTRGVADRDKILNKYKDFEFTDGAPAFYASTSNDGNTPMYRLYNKRTGAQLYTRGQADRDKILNKWHDFEFTDGAPAFYASMTPGIGLTPIFRLYNTKTGMHLYTKGINDRDKILNKYPDFEFTDGVPAFYAKTS